MREHRLFQLKGYKLICRSLLEKDVFEWAGGSELSKT